MAKYPFEFKKKIVLEYLPGKGSQSYDYLKNNDISIKDGTDVNSIMRDMMSVLLEGALDEELDEELGYSKYDYRNKETDKLRHGEAVRMIINGECGAFSMKLLQCFLAAAMRKEWVQKVETDTEA